MKYLFVILIFFLFAECKNHSVRVKNYLADDLHSLNVGSVQIGEVKSGEMTGYLPIPAGDFVVTANNRMIGSGKVNGYGKHKWTIYVSISGALSIAED